MPAQTPPRPVILLEFSELAPALALGLPSFRRFHAESRVYLTDAQEERQNLAPGIQWGTVHTGLSHAEQGLHQKCIWDLASDQGLRVWVCGSLGAHYHLPLNGCVLPDEATSAIAPHPLDLLSSTRPVHSADLRWDLFWRLYQRMRPHLSTFFVGAAGLPGYLDLDALLGNILRLAGRDATLVLCTALGGGSKNGPYHPDGFCWIRTPDQIHAATERKVPLRAVAPTVLRLLGVPIPARMTAKPLLDERAPEPARRVAAVI